MNKHFKPDPTVEYYNQNESDFIKRTINVDMSHAYIRFLEVIPAGARILDAGCGSGRDSKYFVEHGLDVVAIDASEKMVNHTREYAGVKVEQLRFDQLQYKEEFDGVWACASLLHVRKEEFVSAFENLVTALKSGGVIYVSLKQSESKVPDGGRHFSYYSTGELNGIISDQPGLELLDLWILEREDCTWINFLAKRL
jgi:2-polyprenyl-3-methyl-5-hydroxy-6-metoxy-1,4-benzoquinol methylase